MDYQLEIKQIVDYPRCRMYREFIRRIMEDRNIRTNGSSYLFYFVILCSYVNFRSSYRRLDGITYLVEPGQWICRAVRVVPNAIPTSGHFYSGHAEKAALHNLFQTWPGKPYKIFNYRLENLKYRVGI